MNRNTSVRLTIASSVAAVLLLIGVAGEPSNHFSARRDTLADVIQVSNVDDATECVADYGDHRGTITPEIATAADEHKLKETLARIEETQTEAQDDDATKVRKATFEWVKAKYPDAKIEGVFMLAFAKGNLYLAGADTQFGEGKRRTVDVLVRRYTKKSGGQYFRAEGLEPEQAAKYRQKADFDEDATETATSPDNSNATGWDDPDECLR